MSRKVFTQVLVFILIAGLATGCATSGNTQNSPVSAGTAAAATTPAATAKKDNFNPTGYPIVDNKITVTAAINTYNYYGKPEEMSYWKKLEEVTNIHIKWTLIPDDDGTAWSLYLASNDFPDFIQGGLKNDAQYRYGVEGGRFYDFSKELYEYMPNLVAVFKEYPYAEKVIRQINGAIYTLPRIEKAPTSAAGQMFYRTDYLENVGMKAPTTVDEFYNALAAIKKANLTQGYAPLLPYSKSNFTKNTEPFLFAAFGESTEPNFADDGSGKVVYNRISDQYRYYLEFLNRLFNEKLLENEFYTLDTATTAARAKGGQAAFLSNASNILEADFPDGKIHLDCLAPLTSQYTDTKKVQGYNSIRTQGPAINKDSKYVKELLRMFDINYAKEEVVPGSGLYCLSQNIGLQGTDWDYTNAEKTAFAFKLPTDWTGSIWDWESKYVSWYQEYSVYDQMVTSGSGNSLARETGMMKNNIPYAVPLFPDSLMRFTSAEATAKANKFTDIESYVSQTEAQSITGVKPLSEWNEYVQKVKDMGIDEVLKIEQTAYDRWNK